ncbi:hypothetical protein [Anaerosacchariphilus polymeriproducens]|nr:hypothetical protein [Anaerosacchariphilus polymeriproducens]
MMKWYRKLYIGEKAKKDRFKFIWQVKHRHIVWNGYVITLASNEQNLLDIIQVTELLQPYYKNRELFIVGIAKGYDEALIVAKDIIDEVYQKTGEFNIRQFILNCQKGNMSSS